MNKQTSSYIETFLNYLSEIDRSYPITKAELEKKDAETQDILHELELGDNNYKERAKIATKLRNIRKERRQLKDRIEETEILYQWMNENKTSINKLQQVLGQTRKQEKYHSNRTYHKRVLN